jgi:hypothetical protein
LSLEEATKRGLLESRWILVPIALAIYVVAIFLIRPFVAENWPWAVVDLTEMSLGILGALVFALVAQRFNWFSTRPGLIAILLSVGLVLLALGDLSFTYYEAIGEEPFPSIADVFYLTAYLPFAIALLLNIKTIKMKFSQPMLVTWIGLSVVALVAIIWFAIIPVTEAGVSLDTLILITYPIEDFIIFTLALVILLKFRSGEIAKPWALLVIGFILEAIGDILFLNADATGTYDIYHPSDLLLSLAYVAIIASGLFFMLMYRVHGVKKSA